MRVNATRKAPHLACCFLTPGVTWAGHLGKREGHSTRRQQIGGGWSAAICGYLGKGHTTGNSCNTCKFRTKSPVWLMSTGHGETPLLWEIRRETWQCLHSLNAHPCWPSKATSGGTSLTRSVSHAHGCLRHHGFKGPRSGAARVHRQETVTGRCCPRHGSVCSRGPWAALGADVGGWFGVIGLKVGTGPPSPWATASECEGHLNRGEANEKGKSPFCYMVQCTELLIMRLLRARLFHRERVQSWHKKEPV